MKKSRKILVAAGAAALVLAVGAASVFGVSAHSRNEARETALKYLPADAQLIAQERDDDSYEFKFHSAEQAEKYELEVGRQTKELTEWKSQADNSAGAKSVKLTQQQAEQIVTGEIEGASITKTQLVEDDGLQVYEVSFQSDQCRGSYDIHPESGLILEREIKIGAPIVVPLTNAPAAEASNPSGSGADQQEQASGFIGFDEAKEIALAKVPGAVITDIDLDREKDAYVYEFELYKDGYEYDLVLNAQDGSQLSLKKEKDDDWNWQYHGDRTPVTQATTQAAQSGGSNQKPAGNDSQNTQQTQANNKTYIGLAKAKEIVLQKAPGATIYKIELERDDGRISYEGEARKGNVEYEFDIDAYTGTILSWEVEQKGASTAAQGSAVIGLEKAKAIVLNKLPGGKIVEIELDYDDGRKIYEGEAQKDNMEYDFEIDAGTGTVLKWEEERIDWD